MSTTLHWHTNLDRARTEAANTNRPILSLALLGRLDEAQSCANSRFFKKSLYPNPEVRNALAKSYVLHWQTVRPVPKLTIDFGDGRIVKRTVTGNSAHLILDPQGRVADALPGLYDPQTFLTCLSDADEHARAITGLSDRSARDTLRTRHAASVEALQQRAPNPPHEPPHYPTAREAGALAITKMRLEDPLLRFIEASQDADTAHNERELHRRVHERFATPEGAPLDREAFVSWMYEDIFRMPLDDPWLGLGALE